MLSASKTAAPSGGYNLTNSLRFRASASATLTRTFGSTYTDKTKSTFSVWLKRGKLNDGNGQAFLYYNSSGSSGSFGFAGANSGGTLINDCISIGNRNATTGSGDYGFQTTALYRDPLAWYHIVIVFDTGQATASNRFKLYVNGTQVTAFVSTQYPTLNYQSTALLGGNAVAHQIGFNANTGASNYSDLYLAEVNFIDGQALTPSSFGSTDATTGQWLPAKYTGTYGTNGFYLPFSDIATTSGSNAGLGKDFSGNANYWNTNNISVTAGTTYDAMIDSPTLTSATVANYAVLNPVSKSFSQPTFSNANLTVASNAANYQNAFSSIGTGTTGKYYCEILFAGSASSALFCGISNSSEINYFTTTADVIGGTANGYSIALLSGNKYSNGVSSSYGSSFSNGDIIQIAYDADNGKLWFGKNGTYFASGNPASGTNEAFSGITGTYFIGVTAYQHPTLGTSTYNANFGQRPFSYTPPTGFVALNTFNLPTSTIVKGNTVMDATLWTGNGTSQTIVNSGAFRPDLVWIKQRSSTEQNQLMDSVRGSSKVLNSNLTNAESTDATKLTAFNSNGFSIGSELAVNANGSTYVGWQWQAGQGSTSSNTSGSITSTVSVNATAGFSVVTYTGTGANATVGHGLGVAPKFIILKSRSGVLNWVVYHDSLANTQYIVLNTTAAAATASTIFNNTRPTSTVFSLGSGSTSNTSGGSYVAYCWAEIAGFSKFGSYTGNGSTDGPFVYLGFRPKFVMWKRTDTTSNWYIEDSYREAYNSATSPNELYANLNSAEGTNGSPIFLSNGFKLTSTGAGYNASGGTYIYMAFAENPFKNALAR